MILSVFVKYWYIHYYHKFKVEHFKGESIIN